MVSELKRSLDVRKRHDTAVVLHLYYPEVWGTLCSHFRHLGPDFDLLVTVPNGVELPETEIRRVFPDAQVVPCENRGRDIAPFLQVLAAISPLGYKYACKLHTKKSPHLTSGQAWHEDMVGKLLASADGVAAVKSAFDGHPDWGLVGPRGHVLPLMPESYYWGRNADRVLDLARAAGIEVTDVNHLEFSFVGGSMFWFKPSALRLVVNLGLRTEDFEVEDGRVDGTMAHAVERFIGLAANRSGFTIAECDADGVKQADIPFHLRMLAQQAHQLNQGDMSLSVATADGRVPREDVSIQKLRDIHAGQTGWIVGKGPSLLMLAGHHFGEGPIIAINDALIAVEALGLSNPIYSMQKDNPLFFPPKGDQDLGRSSFIPISAATLLVHAHESLNRLTEYEPRYVFDNITDFGLEWWEFSSLVAVAIARLMGCNKVVFVAHDACVFGDARTCTPRPDGSFQVELEPPSSDNYLQHRQRIDTYLEQVAMPAEWLTPQFGEARRQAHEHSLGRLNQLIGKLQVELEHRGSEVERLLNLTDAQRQERDELARVNRSVEALTKELGRTQLRVHDLLSSASWRWMAPLRAVKRLLTREER